MDRIFDKPLKEKKEYRYDGREYSPVGRISCGIGIVCWVVFILLVMQSRNSEVLPEQVTMGAFLDLLLAITGMILAGKGLKEGNLVFRAAFVGAILCTAMTVVYFGLILVGLAL